MKHFNTFAFNSPSNSGYQSPHTISPNFIFPSSQSDSRNNDQRTAHFIRDQTQKQIISSEAIKEAPERVLQDFEEDRHSQISLLLSQVSVPGAQRPQYDSRRLLTLQNNITQHVLELREHKITLMQEVSRLLDTKNLHEHYLFKKSKEADDRLTAYDSRVHQASKSPQSPEEEIVPTHISAQILRKNEALNLKLKELKIKQEIFGPSYREVEAEDIKNKKILEEIMKVRQLNNNIKEEIVSKLKNIQKEKESSRFVTFLPTDKHKHQQSNVLQQLQELKQKYAKLLALSKQPVFKLSSQEQAYVESLRKENQELLAQVDQLLKLKQMSRLPELRARLEENQRQKALFLGELQKFKSAMQAAKNQNSRLKRELNI